jgi:ABC-type amino acid transport substrate-binding protein
MTRRLGALVAALAVALLLPACFSNDDGGAVGGGNGPGTASLGSRVPAAVRRRGTLRVGIIAGRAPLAVVADGATSPTGVDVDLVTQVASSLGLHPILTVEADAGALQADLARDAVDLAVGGTPGSSGWPADAVAVRYLAGGALNPLGGPEIMVRGGSTGLAAAVKAALEAMIADRRYATILERGGVAGQAVSEVAVTPVNG